MLTLPEVLEKLRQRKVKYEVAVREDERVGSDSYSGSVARHKLSELNYVLSLFGMAEATESLIKRGGCENDLSEQDS